MNSSPTAVAIFLFPEVEVLDFAGPYEVFTTACRAAKMESAAAPAPFTVFTVAREPGTVRARAGLVVTPDYTFSNHPPIDLLIIPGGVITPQLKTLGVADWIRQTSATARLTASVCTGAFLLAQAGLLEGKRATTYWSDVRELREMFPLLTVLEQIRWVDEGAIVTSAGISAGIDMSLHLVERLAGRQLALNTAHRMEFDWHEAAQA